MTSFFWASFLHQIERTYSSLNQRLKNKNLLTESRSYSLLFYINLSFPHMTETVINIKETKNPPLHTNLSPCNVNVIQTPYSNVS